MAVTPPGTGTSRLAARAWLVSEQTPGNGGSSAAGVWAQVLDHGSQGRQEPLVQLPEDVIAALSTGGAGADDGAGAAEREGFGRWTGVGR